MGSEFLNPELRNFYVERPDVFAPHGGPSMTRQEFADECDINVLMQRYDKVGVWPLPPNDTPPVYFDCSNVPDLHAAFEVHKAAEAAFMQLPAKVRREFENSPIAFAEYASDPQNLGQMREWGLAPPAPPKAAPEPPAGVASASAASGGASGPSPAPPNGTAP